MSERTCVYQHASGGYCGLTEDANVHRLRIGRAHPFVPAPETAEAQDEAVVETLDEDFNTRDWRVGITVWTVPKAVEAAIRAPLEERIRAADQRTGNLLARIFRDGGQRAATFATLDEACAQADTEAAEFIVGHDNLAARVEAAEERIRELTLNRDAAESFAQSQMAENARLRAALRAAGNELGVPGEGYPAPVSNAAEIIRAALATSSTEATDYWCGHDAHVPGDCPEAATKEGDAG